MALQKEWQPKLDPNQIHTWGFFNYDPNRKLVLRDMKDGEYTVEQRLNFNQAVILDTLLSRPETRVPYAELLPYLNLRGKTHESFSFQPDLNSLRIRIDDVSFGPDPRAGNFNLWRYINLFINNPDGAEREGSGGLILLNRTAKNVRELVNAHTPNWSERSSILVDLSPR